MKCFSLIVLAVLPTLAGIAAWPLGQWIPARYLNNVLFAYSGLLMLFLLAVLVQPDWEQTIERWIATIRRNLKT